MNTRNVAIAALLGLGLLGATMLQARNVAGPPQSPSAAAAADTRGVAAEGRVVAYPGAEVQVSAEWSGRITRVHVEESQRVRKGELLAEIDSAELRAALDEARARVLEAEAEVKLAEANLARRDRLVAEQILAAHDLDEARRDLDTACARRETARAAVDRYQSQLAKTRILAPIDGTVIARSVDAGERLEAGDAVATLADLDRLRVEGEADEADAGALVLGARVAIVSDGYPGERWRGTVEEIADSVTLRKLKPQDPGRPTDTRILTVKVAFAEPTPLKLGTTVELRIEPVP